jgi:hypothetical protein
LAPRNGAIRRDQSSIFFGERRALLGGARAVACGALRIDRREALGDGVDDDQRLPRVVQIVWVAAGVDVAHRAVDLLRGDLEAPHHGRAVQEAGGARHDLGVTRAHLEVGQPADLQLQASRQQQVGPRQRERQAGARVHEVRVLRGQRQRRDGAAVPHDRARQRGQIGQGGDHADLGRGQAGRERGE